MGQLPHDLIWTRRRGTTHPPPIPTLLRAGQAPLNIHLHYRLGEIRDLQLSTHPPTDIALRVYPALRDENWATLPATLVSESITTTPTGFDVSFTLHYTRDNTLLLSATGRISAHTDGPDLLLHWHFDATAHSSFLANRIGFCILHPASLAAAPVHLTTTSAATHARFPNHLDPRQPLSGFTDLIALHHNLPPNLSAHWSFTGEEFETEDQRNWTDASFKTYCTPLSRPRPVHIHPGTRIQQSLTLRLSTASPPPPAPITTSSASADITLTLNPSLHTFPPLRFGLDLAPDPISPADLASLPPVNHIRIELRPSEPTFKSDLARGMDLARRLNCGIELAVFSPTFDPSWLSDLAPASVWAPLLARAGFCFYHPRETYTGAPWPPADRAALQSLFPTTPLTSGTDGDYIFLGRFHDLPPLDAHHVCFSINPQTHAFDDQSLLETLPIQATTVRSARILAFGRGVVVSPITLRPRRNLYAAPTSNPAPLNLPDPRIKSLFAAGWTLASITHLAHALATRATYHATHGPAGIAQTPTAELLHWFSPATSTPWTLLPTPSPLLLTALLTSPSHLLLASHAPHPLRIHLPSPFHHAHASLIDDHWYDAGPHSPSVSTHIDLPPYSLAKLTRKGAP